MKKKKLTLMVLLFCLKSLTACNEDEGRIISYADKLRESADLECGSFKDNTVSVLLEFDQEFGGEFKENKVMLTDIYNEVKTKNSVLSSIAGKNFWYLEDQDRIYLLTLKLSDLRNTDLKFLLSTIDKDGLDSLNDAEKEFFKESAKLVLDQVTMQLSGDFSEILQSSKQINHLNCQ